MGVIPVGGKSHDLIQSALFLEQVRGARHDFELPMARHSSEGHFIKFDNVGIGSANDQRVGADTRGSAPPARSGRPPRDTTADIWL
jgi:hypothetical protein